MSKYCKSCGAANADSAGFCNRCGQPLSASAVGGMGNVASPDQTVSLKRKIPKAGIIAVIVIILIIIAVIFVGKHKNRIVGTWEGQESYKITFTSDGKWYSQSWDDDDDYGTYELSGNTLKLYRYDGYLDEWEIEISDNIMAIKVTYVDEDGIQQTETEDVFRKVE